MEIHSGFQPSCEVGSPAELFGRNRLGGVLDQVSMLLRLGTNLQIIGERRAGKTSLLYSCATRLENDAPHLLSVYVNFRSHYFVRGYAPAYRYVLASIHSERTRVHPSSCLENYLLSGIELPGNEDLWVHYETLGRIEEHKIGSVLQEYLDELASLGIGVILFLDEYEHLFRQTFGGEAGAFFQLRNISSQPPAEKGSAKPLTYVIAGAEPWDQLSDTTGSPELNNIGGTFYIEPLDESAFREMWVHCLTTSSDTVRTRMRDSGFSPTEVFRLSGGWPFFGKAIGELLAVGAQSEAELLHALRQHYEIWWSHLKELDRKVLQAVVNDNPLRPEQRVVDLVRRGILTETTPETFEICGILWKRYLLEQLRNSSVDNVALPVGGPKLHTDVDELVIQIEETIYVINETALNSGGSEVFVCSNQDINIYRNLRNPTHDSQSFSHFALAVYNLIFERTKGPRESGGRVRSRRPDSTAKPLMRLPEGYRRQRKLVQTVDILRHHFGKAHVTRLPSFNEGASGVTVGELLERYLGRRTHPDDSSFVLLQTAVLKDVLEFLHQVRTALANG